MLHGRGIYPLRDMSPTVWGLPDISGRQSASANLQYHQLTPAPTVLHPAATLQQQPQVVWSHGVTGFSPHALHHQAVPYSLHPISVLNALQQNSVMIRPDLITNYAAGYGVSSFMTAPALGPPVPIPINSKIYAPRMDKNDNNIVTNARVFEMGKPDFSKMPPTVDAADIGMLQSLKIDVPKAVESNTIVDESLLKVVSTILDDEPEVVLSDGDADELELSSSLHNQSGTIGQPLSAKPIELPSLLKNSLCEMSPRKEIKLIKKQGSTGTVINLRANFYPILQADKMKIYKYIVKVTPAVQHNSPVFKAVLDGCQEALGSFVLQDGHVFCSKLLFGNACKFFSQCEGSSYYVHLIDKGEANEDERFSVLQQLFKKVMSSMQLFQVGAAYFSKDANFRTLPGKLTGWTVRPGFLPQVVRCEKGFQLNIDVVHLIVRPETALEAYQYVHTRSNHGDETFKSFITGSHVVTSYNSRIYRITDVKFSFSPDKTFAFKDGVHTFKEFYEKKYGITIKQKKQPLLVANVFSGGKVTEVYLVPELCRMVGLSNDQRKDFFLTRSICDEVSKSPHSLSQELLKFTKSLISSEKSKAVEIFKQWDFGLSNEMVKLVGRQLPGETCKVGANQKHQVPVKNLFDWTEEWRSCIMLNCVPIKRWAIVVPVTMLKITEHYMSKVLDSTSKNLGISMSEPFYIQIENEDSTSYTRELKILLNKEKPQLVFCILSCNREDRYRAIKKICSVEYGVPSQVVVKRSMETAKYDHPIAKRLAVQVNCKVGGTPWSVEVPLRLGMIVGIDICVDSRNRSISYASIVASYNKDYSKFFSTSFKFNSKDLEELSTGICEHVAKAIHRFKTFQSHFPAVIVIYRDGVSNKVLPHVVCREMPLLKKWLNEIYKEAKWHMSFIVVSKHSNAKIMPLNDGGELHSGTVVDTCITRPERYDFYLLSGQTRRDRVPTFTHYNVIFDNTSLNPDKLQRLTYKMTHLYFNIKGTVRVPAPLRYATRLVSLVGNVLHQPPHHDLSHVLHFL